MQEPGKQKGLKVNIVFLVFLFSYFFFSTAYAQVVEVISPASFSTKIGLLTKIINLGLPAKPLTNHFANAFKDIENDGEVFSNFVIPSFGYSEKYQISETALSFFASPFSIGITSPTESNLLLGNAVSREISVAGSALTSPFVQRGISKVSGFSKTGLFDQNNFINKIESVNLSLPRIAQIEVLPIKKYTLNSFAGPAVYAESLPKSGVSLAEKKTVPLVDQISLALYCKLASLSFSVDQKRCNYEIVASGLLSTIDQNLKNQSSIITENVPKKDVLETPSTNLFFSTTTTVYVTKYVPVPGPQGPAGVAGKDGRNGVDGKDSVVSANSSSSQYNYTPFFLNTSTAASEIPYYKIRYFVKPGVTGWAQTNQRYIPGNISPQSIEESRIRFSYDLYYVKNRSFWLDMAIFLRTIKTVLSRFGVSVYFPKNK
jgi:hypothetical protein